MLQNDGSPALSVNPYTFSKRLLIIAVILLLLNLCGIYLKKVLLLDNHVSNAIFFFFDASAEANIPTYFSSLILFIAAAILYVIYKATPKASGKKMYWGALMIIFAWLSVDETASIHEQFGKMGKTFHLQSDYLYYSWIIPYIFIAIFAFFFFLKFLIKLPYTTRILFIISGFIYTGAAMGFELFEGKIAKQYGPNTLNDLLLCAVEEFLEMTGVIIFIYALLRYAAATQPNVLLNLTREAETKEQ
jgi:hypothetical protein